MKPSPKYIADKILSKDQDAVNIYLQECHSTLGEFGKKIVQEVMKH